ncbi:gibberellin 2-beta-dioxygenase 1 [Phoenix dactylifera]|uniref:Gibberellin 2-beta-dioxygenase 1 n=1 Tax=Phoenix dactylifera TaxID=42345 RepID=A0A8B7CS94_PHODC|nr:gibberellin 2-beta-dioxygenase 1 [Phoenix dactylifera]
MASTTSTSTAVAAADTSTHRHQLQGSGGVHGHTPAPPPPTPSNQQVSESLSADADAAFSRFLDQLHITPSLSSSFPKYSRLSPISSPSSSHPPNPSPPIISLLEPRPDLLLSAAADVGFFHLADHGLPSHLPASALLESQSLLHSGTIATTNPSSLGFNHDDDGDESDDKDSIFVFEAGWDGFESFPSLVEYAKGLERVGLEVVEMLSSIAGGFPESPFRERKARCLMWVSECSSTGEGEEGMEVGTTTKSKCYPYVVSLQYEMKEWREPSWVLGDSGEWIPVEPCADSILVTLGDIAQVWSNARFKKVRGRPQRTSLRSDGSNYSGRVSLSLLVTLPLDSVISPLLPLAVDDCDQSIADAGDGGCNDGVRKFRTFTLEEYAWRIYHERFPFKDPLLRYRI